MQVSPTKNEVARARKAKRLKARVGRRWRLWILFFRYLRACIFLVNARTLVMSALACTMVYLCQSETLDLKFRMEFSILSVGTVFPLVFSIQQAFNRREEALRNLAILKGLMIGTYFCNRDWDLSDGVGVRANLGNDESAHAMHCASLLTQFLSTLRHWLCGHTAYESESEWRMLYGTTGSRSKGLFWVFVQLSGAFLRGKEGRQEDTDSEDDDDMNGQSDRAEEAAEQDPHWQLYYRMYDIINKINIHNEKIMAFGNVTKAGEAGMSRLAAYTSKTAELIERLRHLREYRTPFMLRYVSFTLVVASIVMAAPYFAFMCTGSRWEDDTSGSCPAGYFTAVLYVLVVSTLFHVQVALENPFDGIGMDDVFYNMDREFAVTLRRYVRSRDATLGHEAAVASGKAVDGGEASAVKSGAVLVASAPVSAVTALDNGRPPGGTTVVEAWKL